MSKNFVAQIFRGPFSQIPILAAGELAFTTDTFELYCGTGTVNKLIGRSVPIDGNYGDLTVTGSGLVWTINANVITASKIAPIAAQTLLGRKTAGTGNVEAITIGEALNFLSPAMGDLLYFNGTMFALLHPARAADVLEGKVVSGNLVPQFVSKGYILLKELQTTGTNGGTFTSGAWQTRNLNLEEFDTGGDCTLSSNQFTLGAGTYEIFASAPAAAVNSHACRLFNVTDTSIEVIGSTEFAGSGVQSNSLLRTRVVFTASKTLRIEHQCQTTVATLGFGIGCAFTTSVFTQVEIHRTA